jgi:hypothetical protein
LAGLKRLHTLELNGSRVTPSAPGQTYATASNSSRSSKSASPCLCQPRNRPRKEGEQAPGFCLHRSAGDSLIGRMASCSLACAGRAAWRSGSRHRATIGTVIS